MEGVPAQVRRWTSCAGPVSYSEIVLAVPERSYGVHVQIKQVDETDRTDQILAGRWLSAY